MTTAAELTLFHNPHSRSVGVRILLEELGADYTLKSIDFQKGEQRSADYLAINPMGKVPAILDRGSLVTEQVAIYIYLADRFPRAGLAPALDDPQRGPYLRWIAYYGSCFEPAIIDKSQKRAPAPPAMCPYGDFDTMLNTFVDQLGRGDWLLGDRYSAADVLWGTALGWMTQFGLVEATPVIAAYLARFNARAAVLRSREKDAALIAASAG
jgi:glutathione S-transferase